MRPHVFGAVRSVTVRVYPATAVGLFSVALEDDESLIDGPMIVQSSGYTTWSEAAVYGLYLVDSRGWIAWNRQDIEARIRKQGRS